MAILEAGAAPFLGGGFGHFFNYAPEKLEYPINRFTMEVKRQLDLLDKELAQKPYIAGNDYTIADIAIWSWYGQLVQGKLHQGSAKFLDASSYQNLVKWSEKLPIVLLLSVAWKSLIKKSSSKKSSSDGFLLQLKERACSYRLLCYNCYNIVKSKRSVRKWKRKL